MHKDWLLGYDIGGTSARAALCMRDPSGTLHVVESLGRGLRHDTSAHAILSLMRQMCDELLERHALSPDDLLAIGVGLAAQIDPTHTIALNAPNLGWRDVPIAALAMETFGRDVYVFNDLNALLWGEFVAGAARGRRDVLAVSVGTGVGGAIIASGELVTGARGQAAEIGHVKVVLSGGRPCGCGEHGCVEAYAGGVHLERAIQALISKEDPAWAAEVWRDGRDGVRMIDLARADALGAQDARLHAILDGAATHLAGVIANACTLLNPELVLLGGGVFTHCANFRAALMARITPLVLGVSRTHLQLVPCALGEQAALLGAAALAAHLGTRR